jgi:hypothetical protein
MKLLPHGHSKLLFFLFTPLKLWRLKALNPKPGPAEFQAPKMEESVSSTKDGRECLKCRRSRRVRAQKSDDQNEGGRRKGGR